MLVSNACRSPCTGHANARSSGDRLSRHTDGVVRTTFPFQQMSTPSRPFARGGWEGWDGDRALWGPHQPYLMTGAILTHEAQSLTQFSRSGWEMDAHRFIPGTKENLAFPGQRMYTMSAGFASRLGVYLGIWPSCRGDDEPGGVVSHVCVQSFSCLSPTKQWPRLTLSKCNKSECRMVSTSRNTAHRVGR